MMIRSQRHYDPDGVAVRSGGADCRMPIPSEHEEEVDGHRVNTNAVAVPPTPWSAARDGAVLNTFHLMARFKSIVNEVVQSLEDHCHPSSSVDDFISVTDDALRAMKTIRMDRRTEARRSAASAMRSAAAPRSSPQELATHDDGTSAGPETVDGGEIAISSCDGAAASCAVAAVVAAPVAASRVIPSKSYLWALKQKRVSPKRSPTLNERPSPEQVDAARTTSALRSEDRQRQAQERRDGHLRDKKLRLELANERNAMAKLRREQAEERLRVETQEKAENGTRRAEEARAQTRERAQRTHSRVEEVLLAKDLKDQNRVLKYDRKMTEAEHNQEQRREEQLKLASERNEAMNAAAERRRNMSQEKAEKQQQREQQRLEALRRAEEQRKVECEMKQMRAEEREKKVQEHQQAASAEVVALGRKVEERIQQSAQLREEQREKQRQRLEKLEQKQKEAKERRDQEAERRTTFHSVMPPSTAVEEEQIAQRLSKSLASAARHGKQFVDGYQKESSLSTKDLNRSKLRSVFARLGSYSATSPGQVRLPLGDLRSVELMDVDHEYIRYFNAYEILVRVLLEARRGFDSTTVILCSDALKRLFNDEIEGRAHIQHFVRGGNMTPLVICTRDEIGTLRKHNTSLVLSAVVSLVHICFDRITHDAASTTKLVEQRDTLLSDIEAAGIDRYHCALLRTCVSESDMEALHLAVLCLQTQALVYSRRKSEEAKSAWLTATVASGFALLQNFLIPSGRTLTAGDALSPNATTVLWCTLRLLNTVSRWRLEDVQKLISDGATGTTAVPPGVLEPCATVTAPGVPQATTRMEVFHVFTGLVQYFCSHTDLWEELPDEEVMENSSPSYAEAQRFGITRRTVQPVHFSRPALPASTPSSVAPSVNAEAQENSMRVTVHEFLLFLGYMTLLNPPMQEVLLWGKGRPFLSLLLSSLPIQYFSVARHILMPTLLSIIFQNPRSILVASEEMDLRQVLGFLQEEYERLPKKAQQFASEQHEAREQAMALSNKVSNKRWADMNEEDNSVTIASYMARSLERRKDQRGEVEKERLCKLLKSPLVSHSGFFRVDRRFPVSLWIDTLNQLRQQFSSAVGTGSLE